MKTDYRKVGLKSATRWCEFICKPSLFWNFARGGEHSRRGRVPSTSVINATLSWDARREKILIRTKKFLRRPLISSLLLFSARVLPEAAELSFTVHRSPLGKLLILFGVLEVVHWMEKFS